MAKLPSSEVNARLALSIFQHCGTRSGEGILPQNMLAIASDRKWSMDELREGLSWGLENGLFEEGKYGFIFLTQTGYEQV